MYQKHLLVYAFSLFFYTNSASYIHILTSESSSATEPCSPDLDAQRQLLIPLTHQLIQKSNIPVADQDYDTPGSSSEEYRIKYPVRLRLKNLSTRRPHAKRNRPSPIAADDEEGPYLADLSGTKRAHKRR